MGYYLRGDDDRRNPLASPSFAASFNGLRGRIQRVSSDKSHNTVPTLIRLIQVHPARYNLVQICRDKAGLGGTKWDLTGRKS